MSLRAFLCRLLGCRRPPEPKTLVRARIRLGTFTLTFTGDFTMKLPFGMQVVATVAFVDAAGNPAKVDGVPVWASDNEGVATVVASDDGMSAVIKAANLGVLATAQISCTADADMGEGARPLSLLGTVEVIAGEAVGGTISFGEPEKA